MTGRLIDAATQEALPGVRVAVEEETQLTAADGRFALTAEPGSHKLRADGEQYLPIAREITVQAGQQVELGDVPMQRLTTPAGAVGMSLRGDSETPVTVAFLLPDGPAGKAGVQPGDQLVAVDGTPIAGVADAVQRLRGAPGSPVQISILRRGTALGFTVVRAP